MRVIVSSCLLGIDCRYCGDGYPQEGILKLIKDHQVIPVCPEQLGGLPTPRQSVELVNGRAVDKCGCDMTEQFLKGAEEVDKISRLFEVKVAILKSNSPSCGCGQVYDGTFSGQLTSGDGMTARLLKKSDIKIYNEDNFKKAF